MTTRTINSKLLSSANLFALWSVACITVLASTGLAGGEILADEKLPSEEDQLIAMINQERQRKGLSLVAKSEQLTRASRDWSQYLVDNNIFEHVVGDSNPGSRAEAVGYQGFVRTENLAGGRTPLEAFRLWLKSPGHYSNMLIPELTEIGLGVNTRGTTRYWTMMGGVRNGAPAVPSGAWIDRYTGSPDYEKNENGGGPILFSQNVIANDSPADPQRPNHRAVVLSGILDQTRKYTIELEGAQVGSAGPVQPYLRMENEARQKLHEGSGEQAKFEFTPKATGCYHFFCGTAGPNQTGGYLFKLTSFPAN